MYVGQGPLLLPQHSNAQDSRTHRNHTGLLGAKPLTVQLAIPWVETTLSSAAHLFPTTQCFEGSSHGRDLTLARQWASPRLFHPLTPIIIQALAPSRLPWWT